VKILNLGCGTKVSNSSNVINIDWSVYLLIKNNPLLMLFSSFIIGKDRFEKIKLLPRNIVCHDLAKGIPFADESVDVVYHSHVLEHLDRDVAEGFLLEISRVLKPGGFHRIVLPDFEKACLSYLSHTKRCDEDASEIEYHESYIAEVIEQSVRKESSSTSKQKPLRRWLENKILGDARKRGETHQWMYDRISIKSLLTRLGYQNISIKEYDTSSIPDWNTYVLDLDEKGNQYKTDSFYIEAQKSVN
jgi:SAM-dependent methyltransferase